MRGVVYFAAGFSIRVPRSEIAGLVVCRQRDRGSTVNGDSVPASRAPLSCPQHVRLDRFPHFRLGTVVVRFLPVGLLACVCDLRHVYMR